MKHPRTRRPPRAKLGLAVAASLALGLAFGVASPASARCVTVGLDSISHTQCNLP